jgi:putative aminopeptidase FrvX
LEVGGLISEVELLGKLSNAFGPSGSEEDVAEILKGRLE